MMAEFQWIMHTTTVSCETDWFLVGYFKNAETCLYILPRQWKDILDLSEPMQNSEWCKNVQPETPISIALLDRQPTRILSERSLAKLINQWKPHCNLRGHLHVHSKLVICTSGPAYGREFLSANAACKQLGIAPSNMYNHLNGKGHYKTLKGCTFAYSKDQNGTNVMSILTKMDQPVITEEPSLVRNPMTRYEFPPGWSAADEIGTGWGYDENGNPKELPGYEPNKHYY